MKKIKLAFLSIAVLLVSSCELDRLFPEYDDIGHGVVARRIVNVAPAGNIGIDDWDNTTITFTVEFYSDKKGADVESYSWTVSHPDVANPAALLTVSKAEFGTSPDGLPSASVSFTGLEARTALGLAFADLDVGDTFNFQGSVTMADGRVFNSTNTSDVLEAQPTFVSFFQFSKSLVCSSALAGTYDAHTDWIDCTDTPGSNDYVTTLTAVAGTIGRYNLEDLSGGMEPIIWSNSAVAATIDDICDQIKLFSAPYSYSYYIDGPLNTFGSGSGVDPVTGVITIYWENSYAEHGVTTLTPQ